MGGEAVYLPQIGYGAAAKWLDRLYLRLARIGATRLTCGSEVLAQILTAHFGTALNPAVLPLGVDLTRFKSVPHSVGTSPLILAVGSLLPVKGHANLIEAVAQLPQVRLRIVGEGPTRPQLAHLINQLVLQERVELVGQLAPEDMPAAYAQADLLALPSFYESQCVALLEGLACSLPVVAAPVGLAPQILTDGRAGQLATDNSPLALAQALKKLLVRSEEWLQLGQAARIAATSYGLEQCSEGFLKLYASIL
jgi:glycosyltransferase involved in cell wall biosynthesis